MAINTATVLSLVKTRLNRLAGDTSLDTYLTARIEAAAKELADVGVTIDTTDSAQLLFLVDYTVWQYQCRDDNGSMPEWLRLRRRELWLNQNVQQGGA